jgi:GrpB-like predicted nucleotidyltransferase (UPF0157 family)
MLDVGRYEETPAIFAEYDPRAPQIAQVLKDTIEAREPRVIVDHIGSTAVARCRGKGVIDLAVTYAAGDLELAKAALDALGFKKTNRPRAVSRDKADAKSGCFRARRHFPSARARYRTQRG